MQDLIYITEPFQASFIKAETERLQFGMPSEPRVGALLRVLALSKPAGCLLELGTGTGLATAWLLAGMDAASTLISVDTNAEAQAVARIALGSDSRLELVLADGSEFLRVQRPRMFDLVFADAMPGKYEGLDGALEVVKIGGFYVIDDMLPQPNWPDGHAARIPLLMQELAQRPDFTMLPLVWSSGVVVAVRTR